MLIKMIIIILRMQCIKAEIPCSILILYLWWQRVVTSIHTIPKGERDEETDKGRQTRRKCKEKKRLPEPYNTQQRSDPWEISFRCQIIKKSGHSNLRIRVYEHVRFTILKKITCTTVETCTPVKVKFSKRILFEVPKQKSRNSHLNVETLY